MTTDDVIAHCDTLSFEDETDLLHAILKHHQTRLRRMQRAMRAVEYETVDYRESRLRGALGAEREG